MANPVSVVRKSEEEIQNYLEFYDDFKSTLRRQYPDYLISDLKISKNDRGEITTYSTWTDFLPTIIPECDLVILVLLQQEGELSNYTNSVASLDLSILLQVMEQNHTISESTHLIYILESPPNNALKQKILTASTSLRRLL